MKILKYKKIKNKYRVYIDNETTIDLYEDIILKYDLLLKKELDEKKLELIKKDNNLEESYQKALSYLNTKMRTKQEIRNYLLRKNFENDNINKTIKRLEEKGLISEELYIRAYINDRINLSSDGPNKIKYSLINEKMNEQLINKYLSELDYNYIEEKLDKLIDKKIKSIKNCSGYVLKQKLLSHFYNLGYSIEMIEDLITKKNLNNSENGEKEYYKLYNKYSKKYDGYELENIIRQKLYSKGFDYDEIKKNI